MNRADALSLMQEYTPSDALRKHMYAVEAAMRAYARKLGEDEDTWGVVGLLHDFDYERFPNAGRSATEEHPSEGSRILAAKGYPDDPQRGSPIRGLAETIEDPDVKIFHAGTRRDGERLIADGGRVLGVTALGQSLGQARERAYAAIDRIEWPDGFCRRDIAWQAVEVEKANGE